MMMKKKDPRVTVLTTKKAKRYAKEKRTGSTRQGDDAGDGADDAGPERELPATGPTRWDAGMR